MAGVPLIAGLPPGLDLGAGYVIRIVALDPATGATVGGVVASDVSLLVRTADSALAGGLAVGDWRLVPGTST